MFVDIQALCLGSFGTCFDILLCADCLSRGLFAWDKDWGVFFRNGNEIIIGSNGSSLSNLDASNCQQLS